MPRSPSRPPRRRSVPLSSPGSAVLDRLTRLHPKIIDLSLGRVERLLDRLGNPQKRLAPVVHVSGTNGKGSTIAFLGAMLEAAGLRVHVHTSPHLVRFNERIRLGGKVITDGALAALLEECEDVNGGEAITFFEITTVAALLAFARQDADIVLLETGLGGRLDATNVIERPLLTVVTPVSMDHQQFLGDTLEQIAAEKAGILKAGAGCVTASQNPAVDRVLEDRARSLGAPLFREGREWSIRGRGGGVIFLSGDGERRLPRPGLAGAHQVQNAGLAVAAAERLAGFSISTTAMADGFRDVHWPGRLQRLTQGPLTASAPPDWEIWVDGGHNPAAAGILADQGRRWGGMHLVMGMLNSKDPAEFLKPLAAVMGRLLCVDIPGEQNCIAAGELARIGRALGLDAKASKDVGVAVADITAGGGPKRVLITGSLYLAGTVLADNA
jgi:dihydrofolate synthase/folylpolyglutamate synthase